MNLQFRGIEGEDNMTNDEFIKMIQDQKTVWINQALKGANDVNKLKLDLETKTSEVNSIQGALQACDHIMSLIQEKSNETSEKEIIAEKNDEDDELEEEEAITEISPMMFNLINNKELSPNFIKELMKLRGKALEDAKKEMDEFDMEWNPSENLLGPDHDPLMGENLN